MAKIKPSDLKKLGPKIGAKELKALEEKFGAAGVARAERYAERNDISIKPGAQNWLDQYRNQPEKELDDKYTPPTQEDYIQTTGAFNIPAGRYSQSEYDVLASSGLLSLEKTLENEIWKTRGLTDKAVAVTQAEAAKYGYDRDLEAKKYLADQDLLKGTRIAEIEGKNRIDLQAIINAGMKDVEGIRGQTERDVANIQGEYGVKQEATRQGGQKDIARIGAEAGFRNALIGAFSF